MVLLSTKAGLRAAEIAQLTWPMVLTGDGRLAGHIELHDRIAKKGSGRIIPIHPALRTALSRLRPEGQTSGPIIRSARGSAMRPTSVVNWFRSFYAELGFEGCSSHSGRRTFITAAAKMVFKAGGSLRDVQQLAGHSSIDQTQAYIEGDSMAKRRLIALL
jgi:integrase/recombinase XerD